MKPKIYCFVNCRESYGLSVSALSEDGVFLAGHLSSSEGFAYHDIGMNSDWKHDIYKKYYSDGYELVWVENARTHEGLLKAYEVHKSYDEKGYAEKTKGIDTSMPSVKITTEKDKEQP